MLWETKWACTTRRKEKWFGCRDRLCGKHPCPGKPTRTYGFENAANWKKCGGEIFTIYAQGKNKGDPIDHKDALRLFYNSELTWVLLWQGLADKNCCPGPAHVLAILLIA